MGLPTGSTLELNLTPHDLLTFEDLVQLTGVTRADLQAKVLAMNNIFFMLDYRLQPKTTWFHVNNPIHLRTPTLSMSDFGYGFNKSFQIKPEQHYKPGVHDASLKQKAMAFLDKVFGNIDKQVPDHIKEQIAEAKERRAQMARTAEELRKER